MNEFDKERLDERGSSSSENLMRSDMETEYIILPSQGFFFTGKYKNIKKIKIRKLDWTDEDILTTKSYYDNDNIIEELLEQTIIDKNFPIDELIQVDIDTIITWLRIGAFGTLYEVPIKCNCNEAKEKKNHPKFIWNLGDFDMPDYPEIYIKELKKNGYIKFHLNNIEFHLTSPTLEKTRKVKEFLNERKKGDSGSKSTSKLLTVIKEIKEGGETIKNIEEIYSWLLKSKYSIKDSRAIQKKAEEINLKIQAKQEYICEYCQRKYIFSLFPVTKYFFGLNLTSYREYMMRSLNFLVFWGRIDYQSVLHMPISKRRYQIDLTHENLKTLYPKS